MYLPVRKCENISCTNCWAILASDAGKRGNKRGQLGDNWEAQYFYSLRCFSHFLIYDTYCYNDYNTLSLIFDHSQTFGTDQQCLSRQVSVQWTSTTSCLISRQFSEHNGETSKRMRPRNSMSCWLAVHEKHAAPVAILEPATSEKKI